MTAIPSSDICADIVICMSTDEPNLEFFGVFTLLEIHLSVLLMFQLPHYQDPDFNDMSIFFPCKIDHTIQYINLGYGAQAPKMVIL
jgi:hypothetical protein